MRDPAHRPRPPTRNVQVDESWSTARLAAEVQQAEREWQAKHGPNAQCPNPKCQFAMQGVSPTVKGERRCPRCGFIFSPTTAPPGPPCAAAQEPLREMK